MRSAHLQIVAVCKAIPGREKELRAAQEKLVAETVKESGCLRYELHQSIEDPHTLVFVETWASEGQWLAHMHGEAIKRFQDTGAGNLFADFTLHRLNLVTDGRQS